jgi:hypothetical protein
MKNGLKQVEDNDEDKNLFSPCRRRIDSLETRMDTLEHNLESSLDKLVSSIEHLTSKISDFADIQKQIIFKIVNWLLFTFLLVIAVLLGIKIADLHLFSKWF